MSKYNEGSIKCPYCGYELDDSWEYTENDCGEKIECGECEKEFILESVSTTIHYATEKTPCKKHKWKYVRSHLHDQKLEFDGSQRPKHVDIPKEQWTNSMRYECENCDECYYRDGKPTKKQLEKKLSQY